MKKTYRRGFKTETNDYAREFREELNFKSHDPLCPWALAKYLEIPVEPLSNYKSEIPEAVIHYTEKESDSFSAITVCDQYRRLIIHNDSHHLHRQAANIAHELGHGILGHMPMPVLDEYGCRYFDREQEDEANWLGPALLISQEAAIHIVKTGMTIEDASVIYGASKQVVKMRINVSGAQKIVSRSSSVKTFKTL
jgi:Zn-dependent peptidase ImmA (M78 family)